MQDHLIPVLIRQQFPNKTMYINFYTKVLNSKFIVHKSSLFL